MDGSQPGGGPDGVYRLVIDGGWVLAKCYSFLEAIAKG